MFFNLPASAATQLKENQITIVSFIIIYLEITVLFTAWKYNIKVSSQISQILTFW